MTISIEELCDDVDTDETLTSNDCFKETDADNAAASLTFVSCSSFSRSFFCAIATALSDSASSRVLLKEFDRSIAEASFSVTDSAADDALFFSVERVSRVEERSDLSAEISLVS